MKQKDKIKEILLTIRGDVIHDCIEIEDWLAIKITDYFFKNNSQQKTAFYWFILNTRKYNFNDKIQLFEEIPYFKKRAYYTNVKTSLRKVQNLRNKLAHWELVESKSKTDHIVLRDPIKVKDFVVTKDIIEDFKKHKKALIDFFLK